jgi:two-component system, cell cycle sensor histidine kinase and response regulator CckA
VDRQTESTVLAVNDTADSLELICLLLKKSGYSVLRARDGQEGLEVARGNHPDLIISDVSMPRMDGIELCRQIRQDAELKWTPVLLVSAVRRDSESVVEGLKAGADDYLEAPYEPIRLIAKVARLLGRRKAEQELRESEERYRLMFERNPHPMWVYDVETLAFLDVNEAAVLRYGYTREEFLKMTIKDIRPPEEIPALMETVSRISRGINESGTWVHRKKDGRLIDVEIISNQLSFAGQKAVLVLANDVTERKKAEEAIKNAEEKYRNIFENAVEGIFQSLPDGKFISANPALARILGYGSAEELIAHRLKIGEEHYVKAETSRELEKMLDEHGVVMGHECEVYRKDRSKIWTLENIRAISDEGGRVAYYEGSLEDISERKGLEEQLRHSQKMEAIGRLAGGVAHDFNNKLTVITMHSDLMRLSLKAGDPLLRRIEEIKKAGESATSLTRQLLAFSRRQVLQFRLINLNSIIADMEKMLRRVIGEHIGLQTLLQPEAHSVKADPGQIEQVIMNLAVNASDAMPKGGRLTIETRNVFLDDAYASTHMAVQPGPYVLLTVTDTGTGMDEETKEHIFEPFFTTKELGRGSGLGLSTVYGIIEQSGGHIQVSSAIGSGTTFKIYLPRAESTEEVRRGSSMTEWTQGTETILLTEDEEIVRNLAREVLVMQGYHVLEAASGDVAVQLCERHQGKIDLLLTDVVMPGMSGREVSAQVTSMRPEVRVIYMSGYTDDMIVHHGVLNEGQDFIQKPFSPNTLVQKVREVLDRPEMRDGSS